ncbi:MULTISPECIES: hypothetical protein [unclassified Nocardioides]|uniref:hypothetical protein n=1 Tax=unclassified Nocardioides TaxID=2615069 RepID=UPI0012EAE45F|nr:MULTISPECIES: hypothetical protein [unclassified Nocardioides]
MDGRSLGSVVGAAGGALFVWNAAGDLAATTWLRAAAVALLVLTVGAALVARRGRGGGGAAPPRSAVRTYGWSVTLMAVAIVVGARAWVALDLEAVVLPWVVLVVGAHFLPFARAFGAPVFTRLGGLLVLVGGAGAVAAGLGVGDAAPVAGLLAGLALLASCLTAEVRGHDPGPAGAAT